MFKKEKNLKKAGITMSKKILCLMLAAMMLATGMAVFADEESEAVRLEGENFNLLIGGVETEINPDVIQTGWSGQSNNKGLYVNNASVVQARAQFYAQEAGYYKMKYVANVYASDSTMTYQSRYNIILNNKTYSGAAATKLNENPLADTSTEGVYFISVELQKGLNSVDFITTTAKTNDSKYLLYLDYVEFTPLEAVRFEFESTKATENTALSNHSVAALSGGIGAQLMSDTVNSLTAGIEASCAGVYRLVWSASKCTYTTDWRSGYTLTVNGEEVTNITVGSAYQGHSNYYLHTAEVELQQGVNSFVFNLNESSGASGKKYVFYCDYIEYSLLSEGESGIVVIEGENYSELDNVGIAGTISTSYSKDAQGNKTEDEVSKISGSLLLANTNEIPGTLKYISKVPADGNYTMTLDLYAQVANQTWLSPVAVTIKQGEDVILDSVIISSSGTYRKWLSSDSYQSAACDVTVDEGEFLYTTQYSNDFYRYTYYEPVTLTEGSVEVDISVISERSGDGISITEGSGYFGLDKIALERELDYETVSIKAEDDIVCTGNTMRLLVADELNITLDEGIIWSSSNENIFTVDQTGLLTAKNPGSATVTAATSYNGASKTLRKEIITITEGERFVVYSAAIENSKLNVQYFSMADLDEEDVTFIVGRYPSAGAALSEVNSLKLSGNAPYMLRTASIDLSDVTGKIKLFTWKSLENLSPVFSAIDIQ